MRYSRVVSSSLVMLRKFTQNDVTLFSELSGDKNEIHVGDIRGKRNIVHGTLILGAFSGLIASHYPYAVLQSITSTFHSPLYVGEEMKIQADIEGLDRAIATFRYQAEQLETNTLLVDGEAKVVLPRSALRNLRELFMNV